MQKRTITYLAAMLLTVTAINARAEGPLYVGDLSVAEADGRVRVSFTARVGEDAVRRSGTMVFAPVISDGQYNVSMPAVVVEGKGARQSRDRREWVAGYAAAYPGAICTTNGQQFEYSASVPAQPWMQGAVLFMESVAGGCCDYVTQADMLLADNLRLWEDPAPEPEKSAPRLTTGDQLSLIYPFVISFSDFDQNDPFKIYDDERENALVIRFSVADYIIDAGLLENSRTLETLTGAINAIVNSDDSRVKQIMVAGFTSPEGNFESNNRLAFERAVSVKEHIMARSGIDDEDIMIYNGSTDWRGLRAMIVKSTLPEKDQVISAIDNTQGSGRLNALKRLNGGRTYRHLLKEYFPYLRSGALIRVYYENE